MTVLTNFNAVRQYHYEKLAFTKTPVCLYDTQVKKYQIECQMSTYQHP